MEKCFGCQVSKSDWDLFTSVFHTSYKCYVPCFLRWVWTSVFRHGVSDQPVQTCTTNLRVFRAAMPELGPSSRTRPPAAYVQRDSTAVHFIELMRTDSKKTILIISSKSSNSHLFFFFLVSTNRHSLPHPPPRVCGCLLLQLIYVFVTRM